MVPTVDYQLHGRIATIRIDDEKRNALSLPVLTAIHEAFERARSDRATVIVTGRDSVFSAGFDLKTMKRGGADALRMLRAGYSLPARVMSHPWPVVAACNGHVLAMGVFLLLSADHVVGSRGDFKVSANEVAIGLKLPRVAETVLRHRLSPAAFQRAAILAEYFDVEAARAAGFFDELVEPADVLSRARARAEQLLELNEQAHSSTKRRVRAAVLRRLRYCVPLDLMDAALLGLRGTRPR